MFSKYIKYSLYFLMIFLLMIAKAYSETVKSIVLDGNNRISKETILMFADVKIGDDLTALEINDILNLAFTIID